MTRTANVAVAISTRDRPNALDRCLAAIGQCTVLPQHIVIVDQSANSQTEAIAQAHAASLPISYIRHHGSGLGAAQNLAFAHARCPIVLVTDDDCVPAPDWIGVIERTFSRSEELVLVTGRVLPLGPDAPDSYPVSLRTSTYLVDFGSNATPWDIGSGNNFAVKREWFLRIGGNDTRLGPGSQGRGGVDMDLFHRILRSGARIRFEPDAVVYHERTTRQGRISRRVPYGFGIGACCVLWLRQGDRRGATILGRWVVMRVRRLLAALHCVQWMAAYEEVLVLMGTLRGLGYGACVREKA